MNYKYNFAKEITQNIREEMLEYYKTHSAKEVAEKFQTPVNIATNILKLSPFRKMKYRKRKAPYTIIENELFSENKNSPQEFSYKAIEIPDHKEEKEVSVSNPSKKSKTAVIISDNPQDIIDILNGL